MAAEPLRRRTRAMRWVLYVCIATIIALVPCVIFPELILPFDHWSAWEESHFGRRVEYSGANIPRALRIEVPVFTGIVLPPQWLAERVGYHRTMYGDLAMSHAGLNHPGSFHYTPPPTIAAAEHLAVALPFWLAIVAGIGEVLGRFRRRRKKSARAA
ncbi:MAG: hypothetical protein ACXW5U_03335 [Thermoanaerobaculia bacterium]